MHDITRGFNKLLSGDVFVEDRIDLQEGIRVLSVYGKIRRKNMKGDSLTLYHWIIGFVFGFGLYCAGIKVRGGLYPC